MKGIILAAGHGTRLSPLTKVTSKQLLPVYDMPMIYYPLQTLLNAGITEILFILPPERSGDFLRFLGSGKQFGARFTYEIQDKPEGLPQAFTIGESFIGEDSVCMILGDNIFLDDEEPTVAGESTFVRAVKNFKGGGHIFVKEVPDPERFGVVKIAENGKAEKIVEKPKEFLSPYAITGLYIFDSRVTEIAKNLKKSVRDEYEITDIHNWYLQKNELSVDIIKGEWVDAGTFESLFKATELARKKKLNVK